MAWFTIPHWSQRPGSFLRIGGVVFSVNAQRSAGCFWRSFVVIAFYWEFRKRFIQCVVNFGRFMDLSLVLASMKKVTHETSGSTHRQIQLSTLGLFWTWPHFWHGLLLIIGYFPCVGCVTQCTSTSIYLSTGGSRHALQLPTAPAAEARLTESVNCITSDQLSTMFFEQRGLYIYD